VTSALACWPWAPGSRNARIVARRLTPVIRGVKAVDFLSMDIELHEPQALKGFDIERFRPALVCIEGLLPVRQQILDYFADHRYVLVGWYVRVHRKHFYFMPRRQA